MPTPYERFKEAALLRTPDQVPVMPRVTGEFIYSFSGQRLTAKEYYGDIKKQFSLQMRLVKAFPEIKLWPGLFPEVGASLLPSAMGCTVSRPDKAEPSVSSHVVKTPEDIEKLRVPDPKKDGNLPKALEAFEYMSKNTPQGLKNNYGYLNANCSSLGPVSLAVELMGSEMFYAGLYKYPDLIMKSLETASQAVIEWTKAQAQITGGYDFVQLFDDVIAFLNPKQFERFALPCLRETYAPFKHKDNALLLHCDANANHILDALPETGANSFNYGPDVDTGVLKQRVGKSMCLVGGLAPLQELKNGTPKDVERVCKKAFEQGAIDGGFILSTYGSIAAGTPLENVRAMISAADKLGKYPLKL